MKVGRHDKLILIEQEFLALLLIIILGGLFFALRSSLLFYLITLLIGFALFFWMMFEEKIHKRGKKHVYFEHTSSYVMIAQTALVLGLLFLHLNIAYLKFIFLIISVIMYSVSITRITLYKLVFRR